MKNTNDKQSVRICIPAAPVSLNKLLSFHHMELHKYKQLWKRYIWGFVSVRDREWLEAMAGLGKRMRVEIEVTHGRLFDQDNLVSGAGKPILDALVNLNYLAGDSPAFIELHVSQQKLRDEATVISIREAQ